MFCMFLDVAAWLKSLRLHKYGSLFSQLSYEEMLELDENYLESKGVTKGARNKILLSIKKLKDRCEMLQKLEKVLKMFYQLLPWKCTLKNTIHTCTVYNIHLYSEIIFQSNAYLIIDYKII
jgi:hypothetical protein